jgi:hypothetical protein
MPIGDGAVNNPTHARAREEKYSVKKFYCKSAQFCVTRCKLHSLGLPIRNAVQHSENVRNSLDLNYKSNGC